MPPDMKMPIIKITPSSPSPDPNHPDYPEFFEDKLYLDHMKAVTANRAKETINGTETTNEIPTSNAKHSPDYNSIVPNENTFVVAQNNGNSNTEEEKASSVIFSKPRPSADFSLVWEDDEEIDHFEKPGDIQKNESDEYNLDDSIEICFESFEKKDRLTNFSQEFMDSQAMCDNAEMDSQNMCDSIENLEEVETNISDEADTPELETQIKIAKQKNLSPSVMQTLQKHAKICDNVVRIDHD